MTDMQFRQETREFDKWLAARGCVESRQNYVMLMEAWFESRRKAVDGQGKLLEAIEAEFGREGLQRVQSHL